MSFLIYVLFLWAVSKDTFFLRNHLKLLTIKWHIWHISERELSFLIEENMYVSPFVLYIYSCYWFTHWQSRFVVQHTDAILYYFFFTFLCLLKKTNRKEEAEFFLKLIQFFMQCSKAQGFWGTEVVADGSFWCSARMGWFILITDTGSLWSEDTEPQSLLQPALTVCVVVKPRTTVYGHSRRDDWIHLISTHSDIAILSISYLWALRPNGIYIATPFSPLKTEGVLRDVNWL